MTLQNLQADMRDRLVSLRRFHRRLNRWPNIIRPKRFTDYLLKERLFCNPDDPFLVMTADKYAARSYVKSRVGEEILSRLFFDVKSAEDISLESIQCPFVLKSSHGNSQMVVVEDKSEINGGNLKDMCGKWLQKKFPLWYRRIPPRILAEEYLGLSDANGPLIENVPKDYKFFVFSGKVQLIMVDTSRFCGHQRSVFTPDWEYINVECVYPTAGPLEKPKNLQYMSWVASALAGDREFMRVDLYDLGDRVVFGEITHSPHAAVIRFRPDSFDFKMGELWASSK